MLASETWSNDRTGDDVSLEIPVGRFRVSVTVDDALITAVEGWRRAHGLREQPEALGALVRLGLMSEIAKIYRLVSDERTEDGERDDHDRRRGKRARPTV